MKMPPRFLRILLSLSLGFVGPSLNTMADTYDPERFEKTTIAADLIQPMEMAIASDGRIFLIELGGKLKVIAPDTKAVTTIGELKVTTAQENGLIGIALDPNFEKNNWIYLQYSPPDFPGQHVSRFEIKDGKLDLASEKIVLKYEEQRMECCHHAGSMEFGPDGNLYIGTGDNTNPFGDTKGYAPIDERESRGAFNAQRTAANTKSHNGKVLRIKPLPEGGYGIPDGNLFPKDGSVGLPEIYVMGCRNPWRINLDKKTGVLYWGDVGPDAGSDGPRGPRGYDEVNQAKRAGNFGWPLFIGNNRPYPRVNFKNDEIGELFDPENPVNESVYNTGAKALPPAQKAWIYYPAGASEEFPVLGSGGRTACAGPVYYYDEKLRSNTKFPDEYDRTLFIFEWSRNWIKAVHLDHDSNMIKIDDFLPHIKFIRPIDIQFSSQGEMYVIEYGETWGVNPDAKLVRLDYVRGNRAPIARVSANETVGREPLTVILSSEGSSDKDNDKLRYQWKYAKADQQLADQKPFSSSPEAKIVFDKPGVYNVQLEIIDTSEAISTATLPVIVGNSKAEIEFNQPRNGEFFTPGQSIEYSLFVNDKEDGVSDEDVADEKEIDFIDSLAPSRMSVQASIVSAASLNKAAEEESQPNGFKLIRGSDCLNCHALERPLVGPTFVEIANKYRDQSGAIEASIDRVLKGSAGVWGKVPMLPHSQHTKEQIREMVGWVYSAKPNPGAQVLQGIRNTVTLLETNKEQVGGLELNASYRDLGRGEIPPIVASKTIRLRPRKFEVEDADEFQGAKVLGSHKAGNGKFLGAIEHDGYVKFSRVPLHQTSQFTVRVTSAGVGGDIELRKGSKDGPVLGRLSVDVNGDWDGWYEKSCEIKKPLEAKSGTTTTPNTQTEPQGKTSSSQDIADVYFVFVNEKNRGGLMNLDSIRFDP